MEKILLAIDAIKPDKGALEFACYLAKLTKSKITGVFLENMAAEERPVLKKMLGTPYLDWEVDEQSAEHNLKVELIEKNISLFKERCINEETRHSVHRDRGVPANELIAESRFADIIVVDAETSFNRRFEGCPTEFVNDVLKKAECPVIIAPETFEEINEIVFAYNNTASSLFSIKLFTYLFPQFHDKKVSIIQVNESGQWNDPDKHNFSEWLKEHYTNLHFEALKGDIDTGLLNYVLKLKNIFLVMGAYGRNTVSEFFKHSSAGILVKTSITPIFIAHL